MTTLPHPLQHLSQEETCVARDLIAASHPGTVIEFREIGLHEPPKAELLLFLGVEHRGVLSETTPRPARQAMVRYDTIGSDRLPRYNEAVVDVRNKEIVQHELMSQDISPGLTTYVIISQAQYTIADETYSGEFAEVVKIIEASSLYKDAIANLHLPDYLEPVIEPWPYGTIEPTDSPTTRYFQGLVYAADKRSGNPDANFYAFPVPIIPVVDFHKREVCRIVELTTGGKGDPLTGKTHAKNPAAHQTTAEYVPELLPGGVRKDLKELSVVQPDGPSFRVSEGSLVEWQKWRFRVSFTPREGAVIHDVHYEGRSLFYRLSISEMVRLILLSFEGQYTNECDYRLCRMRILARHSQGNRRSTSEREEQVAVATI